MSESTSPATEPANKISSCFTTTLELAGEHTSYEADNDIHQMSFLLAIFDNIVGPKVVHYWRTESRNGSANHGKISLIDDQLLKYIAIHTLNGELYQDKLINQLKFRLYLIKEIDYAVFSVFFDASTITVSSYGSSSCGEELDSGDEADAFSDVAMSNSSDSLSKSSRNTVSTSLNCFSVIVPLEKKDIFLKNYGENTNFFINTFENMILEYKVFAQIKPKVKNCQLWWWKGVFKY